MAIKSQADGFACQSGNLFQDGLVRGERLELKLVQVDGDGLRVVVVIAHVFVASTWAWKESTSEVNVEDIIE